MTPASPARSLAATTIFAGLEDSTLWLLAGESRVRRYPRGQVLYNEGDPGGELLLLESGQVKVSRFSSTGQEIVIDEIGAPTSFGELALFDGAPHPATVTATSDVQVRYLGRRTVIALVERDPGLAIAMMRNMSAKMRATSERLSDVLSLDVSGRLAKWLLAHAEDDDSVAVDQSQESLALSLGTTRETINRSLRRFERRGIVEIEGHEIRLLDVAALQSISEG